MHPVQFDNIQYPCFFDSKADAVHAATDYLDEHSTLSVHKFTVVEAYINHKKKWFMVHRNGKALPLKGNAHAH
ncbi:hypothetical protein SAMN04490193_2999 [Pseudomonas marginalis]|nr:hypothetical protein SAMN04490193_2999 [Pseudomonas marginalis]